MPAKRDDEPVKIKYVETDLYQMALFSTPEPGVTCSSKTYDPFFRYEIKKYVLPKHIR
jgi:hypothetical protein